MVGLSNYVLDTFVAPRISVLTECGAPDLPIQESVVPQFQLNALLQHIQLNPQGRSYWLNIIRRAEAAWSAYGEARKALLEYLSNRKLASYFRALAFFEMCVSQIWQAHELLRKATGADAFARGDQSVLERLHDMYNDVKHMEERIHEGKLENTASIWITNIGLESTSVPTGLSFAELVYILQEMRKLAETLAVP
jgi:hypothetical protein